MTSLLPDFWGKRHKAPGAFESLQDEIDRVFDQFRHDFKLPSLTTKNEIGMPQVMMPRIEVSETDGTLEVSAELPGVTEKDIDVTATDNMLTIKAEKKMETKEEKDNIFVSERSYGMFQRTIPLSFEIDPSSVEANFANGVLKVSLPKPPEVQQKSNKIEVKSAE